MQIFHDTISKIFLIFWIAENLENGVGKWKMLASEADVAEAEIASGRSRHRVYRGGVSMIPNFEWRRPKRRIEVTHMKFDVHSETWRLIAVLLLALTAGPAAADCHFSSGGSEQQVVVQVPASVTVSRDATTGGTLFTSPNASPAGSAYLTCTTSSSSGIVNNIGPQPSIGANKFPIYINGNDTGLSFQWIYNGTPATSYGTYPYSGSGAPYNTPHAFRLIKTGQVAAGFVIPGGTVIARGEIGTLDAVDMVLSNNIVVAAAACTTPNIFVNLGSHSPMEMAGIGTGTTPVSFNISLNNCPAGMKPIQYRIDPATAIVNSPLSIVALDSSSSASGVGVQLLNSAGTAAFPLSSYQTFGGYSQSTGGSFTIPLKARYYRTAAISNGRANTSMTFTMQYQ